MTYWDAIIKRWDLHNYSYCKKIWAMFKFVSIFKECLILMDFAGSQKILTFLNFSETPEFATICEFATIALQTS